MIDITGLREDKRPQSSTIVHALLDRLEAAESECLEQARLNGMGASREAALMAKLEAAEKERANANAAAAGIALKAQKLEDDRAIDTQRMAILVAKMNEAERERDALREDRSRFLVEMGRLCAQCDALRAENAALVDDMNLLRDNNTALRAKIEQMEKQKPVEWQARTRPAWNDGTWGPWRKCSEEYAEDIKKTPLLHDWLYEARTLYTLPGAKTQGEEK